MCENVYRIAKSLVLSIPDIVEILMNPDNEKVSLTIGKAKRWRYFEVSVIVLSTKLYIGKVMKTSATS